MAKILMTGGAGFIGSSLARKLVPLGHDVAVVDSLTPQVHKQGLVPGRLPPEVKLFPADIVPRENWQAILSVFRPEVLVHLAAETGTAQSLSSVEHHSRTNVVGTGVMLDALLRLDMVPAHIVLASSRAVYGEGKWSAGDRSFYPGPRTGKQLEAGQWDPEPPADSEGATVRPLPSLAGSVAARPTNIYGATKLAQENLCMAWGASLGCPVSVLRLQNVYGPGQAMDNPHTGLVTLFATVATDLGVIDVYEDGDVMRDFVFIDDVTDALGAAIQKPPAEFRLVDIGLGKSTRISELAALVASMSNAPQPRISGRYRLGDVRAAFCRIDSAADELGYVPQWDLERGLRVLLEWVKDSRS